MADSTPEPEEKEEELREIPKWAERYAGTKVTPVLAWVLTLVLAMVLPLGVLLCCIAVGCGIWVTIAATAVVGIALFYALASSWRRCLVGPGESGVPDRPSPLEKILGRLYERDGRTWSSAKRVGFPAGVVFVTLLVAAPAVVRFLHLPSGYNQPIAAAMLVPAWVLWELWANRGRVAGIQLVFPLLFGLCGLLNVIGVPLGGETSGYSLVISFLLSMVVFWIYNRYALRRLRRLAASPEREEGTGHD